MTADRTASRRPNILLITCDQYRFPRFSYGPDGGFAPGLKAILGFQGEVDDSNPYAKIDQREAIKAAMGTLPQAQKEVVELYYYAGLSLPEIAQSVKRNLNTVKYQFYRAHDQVAQSLAESRA